MTRVVIAIDGSHGHRLAAALVDEGVEVAATVAAAGIPESALDDVQALVLAARREHLTSDIIARCDRRGVRIVALAESEADGRRAASLGVVRVLPVGAEGWEIADAVRAPAPQAAGTAPVQGAARTVVVWGAHGAPGRSTLAVELAVELARGGRRVALIDADTHAPSVALALGLPDEGPGFAAACRRFEYGGLDAAELGRISIPVAVPGGTVEVLAGINRPSRWPELSESRVAGTLAACRGWADYVVVDVAASLERDEEIVSDLDGPHRNAAGLAALRAADIVIAVASADPVGVSRFVRGFAELRAVVGTTRVIVAANRLRPGGLGIDSRGQIRRTLERFAGVRDVAFLPLDPRSADAAMLQARPIAEVAPRSPFVMAVRRLVGEALAGSPAAARDGSTLELTGVDPQRSRVRAGPKRRSRRRVAPQTGR